MPETRIIPPLADLRKILVESWCVCSPDHWTDLTDRHPASPSDILARLSDDTRFRLCRTNLGLLTTELRSVLVAGSPDKAVVTLRGKRWLKLRTLGRGAQGRVWIACPCDSAAKEDQLVGSRSRPCAVNGASG